MTDDDATKPLDDELEAAARAVVAALAAVEVARARRDRALAAYGLRCGMSAPATAVHARSTLIDRRLTDNQIRLVGVSEQTVRPAIRHARSLLTS